MKNRLFLLAVWLLPFATLMGCKTTEPVIVEKIVEVRVPVNAPCVAGERPAEPVALRDRIGRAEWDALTTDQRENLAQAQALDRKLYGDRITIATAGCN